MAVKRNPTAPEIRQIAEELAQQKTVGVVERLRHPEGWEAYKVTVPRGVLLCTREGDGWVIGVNDENGRLIGIWRNTPNEGTRIAGQMVDVILALRPQQRAVFEKQFIQVEGDIHRKIFATGRGQVCVHSRHNDRGTELVLTVADGTILRGQWDRATSTLDVEGMERLDELPF